MRQTRNRLVERIFNLFLGMAVRRQLKPGEQVRVGVVVVAQGLGSLLVLMGDSLPVGACFLTPRKVASAASGANLV